ncbi:hypothetical protein TRIUR3_28042 [Triticum urartu]|uniref:Uncharacterized protein n=1 Tax=Triticum urartu TaxID=4572 RepID=M7ZA98_TRIUA|nr:hypothetical protein TRIUR3_28042 [Triticum urartu]
MEQSKSIDTLEMSLSSSGGYQAVLLLREPYPHPASSLSPHTITRSLFATRRRPPSRAITYRRPQAFVESCLLRVIVIRATSTSTPELEMSDDDDRLLECDWCGDDRGLCDMPQLEALCKAYDFHEDMLVTLDLGDSDIDEENMDIWVLVDTLLILPLFDNIFPMIAYFHFSKNKIPKDCVPDLMFLKEMTKVAQAKSGTLYFMEGVPKSKVCFMFCLKEIKTFDGMSIYIQNVIRIYQAKKVRDLSRGGAKEEGSKEVEPSRRSIPFNSRDVLPPAASKLKHTHTKPHRGSSKKLQALQSDAPAAVLGNGSPPGGPPLDHCLTHTGFSLRVESATTGSCGRVRITWLEAVGDAGIQVSAADLAGSVEGDGGDGLRRSEATQSSPGRTRRFCRCWEDAEATGSGAAAAVAVAVAEDFGGSSSPAFPTPTRPPGGPGSPTSNWTAKPGDAWAEPLPTAPAGVQGHQADGVHQDLYSFAPFCERCWYGCLVDHINTIPECSADLDEKRNICPENCIEAALKLSQGWATVKQSFLNFTEGRSPVEGNVNVDADVKALVVNPLLQKLTDFLSRLKAYPYMSDNDYSAFLQTTQDFCSDRTMTPQEIYKNVPISSSETAFLRVKAYDNHNLDGIHMKEGAHKFSTLLP